MVTPAEFEVALYWLARNGSDDISADIPEWTRVFLWEKRPAELLVLHPHPSPQRRALALQRYRPRRPAQPLQHCMEKARRAPHPQLRLVWLVLLLHHHGPEAIAPLLRAVARRDEFSEACCWALGRLGRDIVLEIGDRHGAATPGVKELYYQALWYLGRRARGCESWPGWGDSPWARAVLFGLEDWGWRLLLQWRASPLWLNQESLAALGEMAFSSEEGDRWYALRALLGWGPAKEGVGRMVEVLCYDSDPELAGAALLALGQLGARLRLPALREILRRCPEKVCRVAVKFFFEKADPTEFSGVPSLADHARENLVLHCLAGLEPELQIRALEFAEIPQWSLQKSARLLEPFLFSPHTLTTRLEAIAAFVRVGGELRILASLLDDPEGEIRLAAAEILVQIAPQEILLGYFQYSEIVSQFHKLAGVLRALLEWSSGDLEHLLQQLSGNPSVAARGILRQLELSAVEWSNYGRFNSTQLAVAKSLIRHNQAFPEELLEKMVSGTFQGAGALALFVRYASPSDLQEHLPRLFQHHPISERLLAWEELQARGEVGWTAALDLLAAAEELVALDAANQLSQWFPGHEWLDRVGLQILESLVHPLIRAVMADWIARVKVHPLAEVSEANQAWALAVLPHVSHFKPMVEGYLDRAQRAGADLTKLLNGYVEHPDLRFDILRWLRLWRPEGVAKKVRAWPADSEPPLQLARLQLLFETDQLTAEEAEQLATLGEVPELAQEVALLKLSLDLRGRGPDL